MWQVGLWQEILDDTVSLQVPAMAGLTAVVALQLPPEAFGRLFPVPAPYLEGKTEIFDSTLTA